MIMFDKLSDRKRESEWERESGPFYGADTQQIETSGACSLC